MMDLQSLFKGIWLGFSIAAPVGPIGLLVLKRAIGSGTLAGLASGLGAALADLIYGVLAVAGIGMAAAYARPTAIAGGLILLYLAWQAWVEKPTGKAASADGRTLLACVVTTFGLTISNPMTILAFAAMVASVGGGAPLRFVAGVFLGSMLWWCLLSLGARWIGASAVARGPWLGRVSALTLACFGVWAIWSRGLR